MRCGTVRKLLTDGRHGRLTSPARAALEQHLDRCADCRAEAAIERQLATDLTLMATEFPGRIDVVARVTRAVARTGGVDRRPIGPWQAAAAALAVTVAAAGGALALVALLPLLPPALEQLAPAATPLTAAAAIARTLGGAALTLVGQLSAAALELLESLVALLQACQPAIRAATLALVLMVVTTTSAVVFRDLKTAPRVPNAKGLRS